MHGDPIQSLDLRSVTVARLTREQRMQMQSTIQKTKELAKTLQVPILLSTQILAPMHIANWGNDWYPLGFEREYTASTHGHRLTILRKKLGQYTNTNRYQL